jgi:predicted DNA-binding transcriptional regulator
MVRVVHERNQTAMTITFDPPLMLNQEYYTPTIDTKPGAVNKAHTVVYEFSGSRIRRWYIERETAKMLFLRRVGATSLDTRRLHKKDLDKAGWCGSVYTFTRGEAVRAASEHIAREQTALAKLIRELSEDVERLGETI